MNFYAELAPYYDKITASGYYNYLETFNKYKKQIKGKNILEIGVGTGNLTRIFCENGFNIDGIEISKPMLSIAKKKLKQYNVRLWNKAIEEFSSRKKYDCVIASASVFVLIKSKAGDVIESYILGESRMKKALNNIFNLFDESGKFIFDFYPEHDPKKRFFDFGEYKYEFEIIKNEEMNDFVKVHYIKKNGKVIATSKIHKIRIPFSAFEILAKGAGFNYIEKRETDGLIVLSKRNLKHQNI